MSIVEDRDAGSTAPGVAGHDWSFPISVGVMQIAGLASIGAGAIHAGMAGVSADHVTLTRLLVAVAVAQIGVGVVALIKGGQLASPGSTDSSNPSQRSSPIQRVPCSVPSPW